MTIKIAMSGAQGTGKTTALNKLQIVLADNFTGLNVARLPEVARDCPWPINEATTPEAQQWIFHEHLAREAAAARGADILLCDRAAIDSLIYSAWAAKRDGHSAAWDRAGDAMSYFLNNQLVTYSKIWFFPPGPALTGDGFRSVSAAFQAEIHNLFLKTIVGLGLRAEFENWPGADEALAEVRRLIG